MEDSETARRALAQAAANGRHVRMALTIVVEIFLIIVFGGLQLRHNWPLGLLDAGYVAAVAFAGGRWATIYHRVEE